MLKILQAKHNISEICICYKNQQKKNQETKNRQCILRHLERIRASQAALGVESPPTNGGRHERQVHLIPRSLVQKDPLEKGMGFLGFSYLEHGVSLHGCSSKAQLLSLPWTRGNSSWPLLLTLNVE